MMQLSFHNLVRKKIGKIEVNAFETLVNDLMRLEFIKIGFLEANQTKDLKSRNGKPDAHLIKKDGSYIAFNYTITSERNIKGKILKDIDDLTKEDCLINNKISQIVTCTNTPINENRILYEQKAQENGWDFKIYSIDKLTHLLINTPTLLKKHFDLDVKNNDSIKYYLCGDRIEILRKERDLTRSEFIELLPINSERELEAIELEQLECSSIMIQEICDLTGVNINWLKHNKGDKYLSYRFCDLKKISLGSMDYFPDISNAYFCLEPNEMNLVILLKFSNYKYGIIKYPFRLHFWQWFDSHNKIEPIFKELKYYYESLSRYSQGRIITDEQLNLLYSNKFFPKEIAEDIRNEGNSWLEELLDYEQYPNRNSYSDRFNWFVKLKEYFKNYYLNIEG